MALNRRQLTARLVFDLHKNMYIGQSTNGEQSCSQMSPGCVFMAPMDVEGSTEDLQRDLHSVASRNVWHTAVVRVCSGEVSHRKLKLSLSSSLVPILGDEEED